MDKFFGKYYNRVGLSMFAFALLGATAFVGASLIDIVVVKGILGFISAVFMLPLLGIAFEHSIVHFKGYRLYISHDLHNVADKATDDRLYALNRSLRDERALSAPNAGKTEGPQALQAARAFLRSGGDMATLEEKALRICTNHEVLFSIESGVTRFDNILVISWKGTEEKTVCFRLNVNR